MAAWTPEQEAALVAALAIGTNPGEVAILGKSENQIRCKARRMGHGSKAQAALRGQEAASFETDGATATVTAKTSKPVRTLAELIAVCEIDTDAWEIESWGCKAWQGFIKDSASQIQTQQLYAVSAKLRAKRLQRNVRAELDGMLSELRNASVPVPCLRIEAEPTGRMLELSIPDAHLGKLAWHRECGQSYDVQIAASLYMAALDDLISKTRGFGPFDQVTLIVGNDFLNADNFENTTARGTPQSTDGRQQKTFWVARRLIVDAIQSRLKSVSPHVRLVMVAGNHDLNTNFYLGEVLDAYFHADTSVSVDNTPTQRKYMEWGECLLMWTHGSEEKHASLPLIMAQERKAEWGRTSYREVHLGHLHKKRATTWEGVNEELGVTVRILPSLCAAEDWHTSRGYVGNVRSAEAYVWDATAGLVGTAVYNVPAHTDAESLAVALAA